MRSSPRTSNIWSLTEARAKFSEVVDRALTEGSQEIIRRGDVVVVISNREYEDILDRKSRSVTNASSLAVPKDEPGEQADSDSIH